MPRVPDGLTQRWSLRCEETVLWLAFSPDGATLAVATGSQALLLDAASGAVRARLAHGDRVYDLDWSPDGARLVSTARDRRVKSWAADGSPLGTLFQHEASGWSVMFDRAGRRLATAAGDRVLVLDARGPEAHHPERAFTVRRAHTATWLPDGSGLVATAYGVPALHRCTLADDAAARVPQPAVPFSGVVFTADGALGAYGDATGNVQLVDPSTLEVVQALEGHAAPVVCVAFSGDGRWLASKSRDDRVMLWERSARQNLAGGRWAPAATLIEEASQKFITGLAFHPSRPALATLGRDDHEVRLFDLDVAALRPRRGRAAVESVSAKVVLVGESNVGKSCLALRLAEGRYEEQGTTHAMRFWPVDAGRLARERTRAAGSSPPTTRARAAAPRREVVLWDMGGQAEYRLVHQLFLHDAGVALVFLDPTRDSSFDDVAGWNKRLEKQLAGRAAVKLLVGTKLDDDAAPVDQARIDALVRDGGFAGYFPTSARSGRGVDALGRAIAGAIPWGELSRTTRPALFQRVRDEIARRRGQDEVVVPHADLVDSLRRAASGELPADAAGAAAAVDAVIHQLALQGALADARVATGERAVVLHVGEVERYAASVILAARDNPRGVPVIELARLARLDDLVLPGLAEGTRLPRKEERVVVECVVELLLQHGICLRHEGLLLFPTELRAGGERDDDFPPGALAVQYDFAGAVDNTWSSLVSWLALSARFGRLRLWEGRAEFSGTGSLLGTLAGTFGLRQRGARGGGFAHLDVYVTAGTPPALRDEFLAFVDEHLEHHGVDVVQRLDLRCATCGHRFDEEAVRRRIADGRDDVGCPLCDSRTRLVEGARRARERDPSLADRTLALRTAVEERLARPVAGSALLPASSSARAAAAPLRILHLSDLHVGERDDVDALVGPLLADLRDPAGGLAPPRVDFLVVSGDLTRRAAPAELERAARVVSRLIEELALSAERCVVVPGNHDLSWDEPVYAHRPRRRVDLAALAPGSFKESGEVVLLRDEARYRERFAAFNRYFHHPLLLREYPLDPAEQAVVLSFPEHGVQFLALNSSWEIDEYFPYRSGIHDGALARGLERARADLARLDEAARARMLRVAVWHHPVAGPDTMARTEFLERLVQERFALCLHGHVHETRVDLVGYARGRSMHVAGAGSLGAPTSDRPESTPRLYQVVEVERPAAAGAPSWRVRVHTRARRRDTGAWGPWAEWPGASALERRAFYEVELA